MGGLPLLVKVGVKKLASNVRFSTYVLSFAWWASACHPAPTDGPPEPGIPADTEDVVDSDITTDTDVARPPDEAVALCSSTDGAPLAGARGCDALDVLQRPDVHLDPTAEALDAALEATLARDDLVEASTRLRAAQATLVRATSSLGFGATCGSAASLRAVIRDIDAAQLAVTAVRDSPTGRESDASVTSAGDFGDLDLRYASTSLLGARIASANLSATAAVNLVDSLCAMQAPSTRVQARVARIDDGSRRIHFEDGSIVGLRAGGREAIDITAGQTVEVDVSLLGDGTGISLAEVAGSLFRPFRVPTACLNVAIAPVQAPPNLNGDYGKKGLPEPTYGKWSLTPVAGYLDDQGQLALEGGMGVAVTSRVCRTTLADTPTSYHRVAARVRWTPTQQPPQVLAHQLDDGDAVSLPVPKGDQPEQGVLEVTTFAQACTSDAPPPCVNGVCPIYPDWSLFNGVPACDEPIAIDVATYPATIAPMGARCAVSFDETTFDLGDGNVTGFRSTTASFAFSPPFALSGFDGDPVTYYADAFAPQAPTAAPPGGRPGAVPITVGDGDDVGVFGFDPCFPNQAAPGGCLASPHPWRVPTDPLVWYPRAVGVRFESGATFAYACKASQQPIIRDRLQVCDGGVDAYYRLPFEPGDDPREVGQGNCSAQGSTHACGGSQEFAYDFVEPEGEPIRAARGGRVIDVKEDVTENCWKKEWCQGNHLILLHADGTYGFYTHMPGNGVWPNVGQYVFRGEGIGVVGNTGNSSSPHLHFHVTDDPDGYGQTQLALFEFFGENPSDDFKSCQVVPTSNDNMGSTNVAPPTTP